jgi:hypothetical protein
MIVQQYDTLALPDVYAAIGYYLRHRAEIQAYLDQRELRGKEVQSRTEERRRDLQDIRRRLLAARPT